MVGTPEAQSWRVHLLAAAVFTLALLLRFLPLLGEDLRRVALLPDRGERSVSPAGLPAGDLRFVTWLVARNAWTLLHRPTRLFDAEPCHPAEQALALGEPGLTLGLLGAPAWALTGDPFLTFHFVLCATVLAAAFAMYLLVRAWTGVPAAGIVAGLFYAFHQARIGDVVHPYIWDNAWSVLALWFAERLFAAGRWRDAAGLAACGALQIGGSLYPLAGTAAVALPLLVWLVVRHGVRHLRPGPVLLVVGVVALAAAGVFGPYLEREASGELERRFQLFLPWSELLPGRTLFPGWAILPVALAGLALRPASGRPDPRWALVGAWLLATYLAAGGNTGQLMQRLARGEPPGAAWPDLYSALASFVPGLALVRAPLNLYTGSHLALAILVGLGAAALLRRAPRRFARPAAAALVLVVAVQLLRAPFLGLEPRPRFVAVDLAPRPEAVAFFAELEAMGNAGPVFELPMNQKNARRTSGSVLLSAYHHRRTAACWGSTWPDTTRELEDVGARLPDADAVRALAAQGFTTLVVRHASSPKPEAPRHFEERATRESDGTLHELHESGSLSAWEIEAVPPQR